MLQKLEKFIFYIFVFSIPFQTRLILGFGPALPGGGFNEWGSFFIYGTDLLLAIIFAFWTARSKFRFAGFKSFAISDVFLAVFLIVSGLSLFFADQILFGWYRLLKIFEFVLLYFYIRSSLGKVFNLVNVFPIIIASGVFQAVVGILQSIVQKSLDLKWLGESVLRTNFSGVAVVASDGDKFLRAYGTLPHPNVLAFWLFLAVFAFYFWYLYWEKRPWWPAVSVYPVLLWGLLATFSRAVIGLMILGVILRLVLIFLKKEQLGIGAVLKRRLLTLFVTTLVIFGAFAFSYWPEVSSRALISRQEQAVTQRIFYTKVGGDMALKHPILGVGLGQFVNNMAKEIKNYPDHIYQPVHNIFLLIADETGILGLAAFICWLFALAHGYIKRTKFRQFYQLSFLIIFLSTLAMGLVDHFLWTIQQGQFMFWLVMALIAYGKESEKKS